MCFFSYKYVIKISLLFEIKPFDNTEKVYESISGHTVENEYFKQPVWHTIYSYSFAIGGLRVSRKAVEFWHGRVEIGQMG